jgi:hypothetical protein
LRRRVEGGKSKKLAKSALNQHNDDRNFSPDFFQV